MGGAKWAMLRVAMCAGRRTKKDRVKPRTILSLQMCKTITTQTRVNHLSVTFKK